MIIIAAVCAACQGSGLRDHVQLAQGRSACRGNGSITVADHPFTRPEIDSLCRAGVRIESLDAKPSSLLLRPGETFSLAALKACTRAADGTVIPSVPVAIEVGHEAVKMEHGRLTALGSGIGTLKMRSLVPRRDGSYAEADVAMIVTR
jgi:hypothetical protein